MRNLTKPVIAAALSVVAAVAMTACTATPTQNSPVPTSPASVPATDPMGTPANPDSQGPAPTQVESTSQSFDGDISNDTITANQMQVEVPKGFKLPEDALVTKAERNSVMMADQDDSATKAMVEASAKAAGYVVYGEIPGGKVFVGHGNAVMFISGPGAQMLTWGPEAMKDVLVGKA